MEHGAEVDGKAKGVKSRGIEDSHERKGRLEVFLSRGTGAS